MGSVAPNYNFERCNGSQYLAFIGPRASPKAGSRTGLICLSLRASEWPSVKATIPVPRWRLLSMPSKPPNWEFCGSMHDQGHQQLLLHKPSTFGIESPSRKFSAGESTEVRLNHGALSKRTPPTTRLSGP